MGPFCAAFQALEEAEEDLADALQRLAAKDAKMQAQTEEIKEQAKRIEYLEKELDRLKKDLGQAIHDRRVMEVGANQSPGSAGTVARSPRGGTRGQREALGYY